MTTDSSISRSWHTWVGFVAGMVVMLLLPLAIDSMLAVPERNAQTVAAFADVESIGNALERYRDDHKRFPTAEEGLAALAPNYLEKVPTDPWGDAYIYDVDPDGRFSDVLTYGSDAQRGGSGPAVDVSHRFGIIAPPPPPVIRWLINATFFAVPLIGLLAGRRWVWANGCLAGAGTLCAVLLIPSGCVVLRSTPGGWIPILLGLFCLGGAISILRGTRFARPVTFAAIVAAFLILITMPPLT